LREISFLLNKHKREEIQILGIYIEVPHFVNSLDTESLWGNLDCCECYIQTERKARKRFLDPRCNFGLRHVLSPIAACKSSTM